MPGFPKCCQGPPNCPVCPDGIPNTATLSGVPLLYRNAGSNCPECNSTTAFSGSFVLDLLPISGPGVIQCTYQYLGDDLGCTSGGGTIYDAHLYPFVQVIVQTTQIICDVRASHVTDGFGTTLVRWVKTKALQDNCRGTHIVPYQSQFNDGLNCDIRASSFPPITLVI